MNNLLNRITNSKMISVQTLKDTACDPSLDPAEQAQINNIIEQVQNHAGTFFAPDLQIFQSAEFLQHAAKDFIEWADEKGDYNPGKEGMDAEQAYLAWLLPLCAEIEIAGVSYFLNHKLMGPEDWFYRRSAWQ